MKIGIRKPSYKKSFSAKTKSRATRSIKKLTRPGYGKKGAGLIKNPKRALYNYGYSRTTTSLYKSTSSRSYTKTTSSVKSSTYSKKIKLHKPSGKSSSVKFTSNYSGSYRYSDDIKHIHHNPYYMDDNREFKQECGLYIEDITSCFEMEYSQILDETYYPLKLKHDEFEIENIAREKIVLDNTIYLNMIKENQSDLINKDINKRKERTKDDLPYLKKINEEYSVCGPKYKTIKQEGYTEFKAIDYYSEEFHYNDRFDSEYNLYSLYHKLSFQGEAKVDFEIKEVNGQFNIYAYYEDENKLKKCHVGYIKDNEINSQLLLCSHINVQLKDMLLNNPRFEIYVKENEYEVIKKYRKDLDVKREERKKLFESRIEDEDVAYQFLSLGVDCENQMYISDAILNYEKSIEVGYSVPFVYERLFLIYRERNDYENAIRIIKKGIEDLRLICEFTEIKTLDYKIGCFEKCLKNMTIKNQSNNKDNNNFRFSTFSNYIKSIFKSNNVLVNEDDNIPKPLKYTSDDVIRQEFYTFQPVGYSTYDKISEYGREVYLYGSFNYTHFCKNKKSVNENKLRLFNNKIKYGKNISINFNLETRDDCTYINSYFYEKNSIIKCEIGFINDEEIARELREYEDVKVFIKSCESDRIKFSIYVK